MKRLKLLTALIAVCIATNLMYAKNPKNGKNDELAELVIEKLSKDVQLTDSQKIVLNANFNAFVSKMENANKKSSEQDKFNSKKQASDEYEMSIDSILNTNQKEHLRIKRTDREKAVK